MARGRGTDRRGRSKRGPPFIRLMHEVFDSPGFRSLRPGARAALLEVARLYAGCNNGQLPMSQRMLAERLSVTKDTAGAYLGELEAAGLVECTRRSGFSLKSREAQAPLWRLAWERCDLTGQPPSHAYRNRPEQKSRAEKPGPNGLENPDRGPQSGPASVLKIRTDTLGRNKVSRAEKPGHYLDSAMRRGLR